MRLAEKNLTLEAIDFGSVDAEAEKNLDRYFIKTPQADLEAKLLRSVFLGRKGAGKSSLFRQLELLHIREGHDALRVIRLTPDAYAWNALRQFREIGLPDEQAHTTAWLFTLAVEIASVLCKESDDRFTLRNQPHLERLRRFIKANFSPRENITTSAATRLLKGLSSFNLEAFGFGMGFSKENKGQALTPQIVDTLYSDIGKLGEDVGTLIALDRLDDSWDGSEEAKSLLIGLIKAGKKINDSFGRPREAKGINCHVFLRSDIYDVLHFDDKDKHRATEELITWSPELLRKMVNERLPENVTVDELFEAGEMRGSLAPFDYIIKRTFLRPREIIQFLGEVLRRCNRSAVEITKEAIRAAEERYSIWKLEDLKQEYRRSNADFGPIIEGLRQGVHRYDSLSELAEHLSAKIAPITARLGEAAVAKVLFDASVIGVRLGNSGTTRFKCEDDDLALPTIGAVYVHQGLYKGLNIKERRAEDAEIQG